MGRHFQSLDYDVTKHSILGAVLNIIPPTKIKMWKDLSLLLHWDLVCLLTVFWAYQQLLKVSWNQDGRRN